MTSIDELFKGVGNKRQSEPLRDPNEIYKSARSNGSSRSNRQARIATSIAYDHVAADPAAPAADDQEGEYGPSLPPEDGGDDEEGRFFGGGISAKESEILDYVDDQDDSTAAEENIDASWLRKTALSFEKRISKNAELRAKYSDPHKFIDSEVDLDNSIKSLSSLAEHSELYSEFARLGCAGSLVALLAHENTDIAISAIEILNELTDEEVRAGETDWGALVDACLEADLLGLLASNLERLDEKEEAEQNGVYHAMNIIENLCSRTTIAETICVQEKLVTWLMKRAQAKENPVSQNKHYAAEILAILCHGNRANRRRLIEMDVVDQFLRLVAAYRKRKPEKGEEEEYMGNVYEVLIYVLNEPEGKTKFVEAEGIELCLIMLKERLISKTPMLRLLRHAVAGTEAGEVCLKLVEAGGLSPIFTLLMKKNDKGMLEHLLAIFEAMLWWLPEDSAERIRTLAKFVENDYEKVRRLIALRREYTTRIEATNGKIQKEQLNMDAAQVERMTDEWFSRQTGAGLYLLQSIDVVLAWLATEDDGAKKTMVALLDERGESLELIKRSLEELVTATADVVDDENKEYRTMLETLLQYMRN